MFVLIFLSFWKASPVFAGAYCEDDYWCNPGETCFNWSCHSAPPPPTTPPCSPNEGLQCGMNACGVYGGVIQCDGSCSGTAPLPPGYGSGCTSSPNSCGQTGSGSIGCSGSCSATTPSNPANYGNGCWSSYNSCSSRNFGQIGCNGLCDATIPPNPAGYGNACTSAPNSCGSTNPGTINCSVSCSATTPSNPVNYGNDCWSAANSCGMKNMGTIQCNGSCSAVKPPDSACPTPTPVPVNGACNNPKIHYGCNVGTSGSQASNPSWYEWYCNGSNGGTNAFCTELKPTPTPLPPINGVCNNPQVHNGCNAGTLGTSGEFPTYYWWYCNGSNGGGNALCNEDKLTNGVCASAHYNCTIGVPRSNQDYGTYWGWSCEGSGGGTTAPCTEPKQAPTCHYNDASGDSYQEQCIDKNGITHTDTCSGNSVVVYLCDSNDLCSPQSTPCNSYVCAVVEAYPSCTQICSPGATRYVCSGNVCTP